MSITGSALIILVLKALLCRVSFLCTRRTRYNVDFGWNCGVRRCWGRMNNPPLFTWLLYTTACSCRWRRDTNKKQPFTVRASSALQNATAVIESRLITPDSQEEEAKEERNMDHWIENAATASLYIAHPMNRQRVYTRPGIVHKQYSNNMGKDSTAVLLLSILAISHTKQQKVEEEGQHTCHPKCM